MRVALTVASLSRNYGGPAAKAIDLTASLTKLGHDVTVIGCGRDDGAAHVVSLPPLARFHATPIPRRIAPLVQLVKAADVLHVLGFRDPVGAAAMVLARRHRVPYVLEPTGMLRPKLRSFRMKRAWDRTIGRSLVAGAALVVATSGAERLELAGEGIPEARLRVRFNGVRLDDLLPLPEPGLVRRRLAISPAVPLVLTIGRIAAIKGLLDIVEALACVPSIHWLVAGPDEGDGTLEALNLARKRDGLADRIFVLPEGLWGRAKAEALRDADAFCMASASESFGSSAAEAACAGLPVVISDSCGVLECLDPSATRTFPHGDIGRLVDALRWAVDDPRARSAALHAAERLQRELTWEGLAAQQAMIYADACGSG